MVLLGASLVPFHFGCVQACSVFVLFSFENTQIKYHKKMTCSASAVAEAKIALLKSDLPAWYSHAYSFFLLLLF